MEYVKLRPLECLFHTNSMKYVISIDGKPVLFLGFRLLGSFKVNLCHMHVYCIYEDYICSFQGRKKGTIQRRLNLFGEPAVLFSVDRENLR